MDQAKGIRFLNVDRNFLYVTTSTSV